MVSIIRTALVSLRRDRAALSLSFVLPVVFFSIFAIIFGGRRDSTPKVTVIVVDEDHSRASERLVKGLQSEQSLIVKTKPEAKQGVAQPEYTAAAAEAAVKAGIAPVAMIVPHGFGANPMSFGGASNGPAVQLLKDPSDMVAPQVAAGLLQKVAMTSMPDVMAELGSRYMDQYAGGFTAEQRKRIDAGLEQLRRETGQRDTTAGGGQNATRNAGLIEVQTRDVVGENKTNPMVSFYAAAIGVMFLLFTASGSSGSLLDEAESGTLDRVLSSHVGGKAGIRDAVGLLATGAHVPLGVGRIQARLPAAHPRLCGDGSVHRLRGWRIWHAAGQPLPHAGATGRPFDAGDPDHVVRGR